MSIQDEDQNDPTYHIHIITAMLNQLPTGMRDPILDQFNQLLSALDYKNKLAIEFWAKVKTSLASELEDLHLDISYMEYDLHSTRRERDEK